MSVVVFVPQEGTSSSSSRCIFHSIEQTRVGVEFVQPTLYASTYLDILKGGLLNTDLSTRIRDLQFGGDFSLSSSTGQLQSYTFGVSLDRPREKISLQAINGINSFLATYHQRLNEQLEVAYKTAWDAKTSNLAMEVGAKYNLFAGGFIKVPCTPIDTLH
jgi:voltage-dependent anion channel protein 2